MSEKSELRDWVRAGTGSMRDWPAERRREFSRSFEGKRFTDNDRQFFKEMYLVVTPADVDRINNVLPPHFRIKPLLAGTGQLVVSLDLATDPQSYPSAAQELLADLDTVKLGPDDLNL